MSNTNPLRAAAAAMVVVAVLLPLRAHAQAQTTVAFKTLHASRTRAPISLDGKLDEAAWGPAEVATDFVQRYPLPGNAATMRTEVRILYDDASIYVGARMFDPHPDSIAAPLARRDPDGITSDWIDVIFDSYHDRRTAYRFGVNPAGTKLDVYHFNDDDDDGSWDANWDVATKIDSLGWVAEFRIPLSQLRFHGAAGEQEWGLQMYRAVARRDEWSHWVAYPPSYPGFVSGFGDLKGLIGLTPPSPIELTPYVSSRVASGGDFEGTAGVDFRVGLGSAFSLTGTVNPDFGQVEVDPAVINLSATETFFPEKRPFFLEGAGIFEFGRIPAFASYGFSRFVHWRRIGRSPQLIPSEPSSRVPLQSTILGAAKLSGQIGNGWSVGALNATTQREAVDVSGRDVTVEPLTSYSVARAKKDFRGGRSNIGVMATAVNRSLDEFSRESLRRSAYLAGMDGSVASRDRVWILSGYGMMSNVTGTPSAVSLTQRSSARYFNRPDADHLEFDSTRTSMSGYDAAASLMYQGKPFYGSLAVSQTSPGYESNDLGYMSRADVRSIAGAFGAQMSGGRGLVRDGRARVYALQGANLGGDVIYRKVGTTASATLNSLWNVSFGASIKPAALDDRTTRGGPLTKFPSVVHFDGSISSDSRKPLMLYVFAAHETFGKSSMWAMYESQLTIRPAPSLRMSIGPSVELNRDEGFFIRSFADSTASSTFGRRYVFADLDLRTTSLTARADWTLTPDLSFQLFAQPFRSNVSYADYKTLRAPSTYSFDPFNDPAATDGFSLRTLRMNAVARWEFRAGSSLYLVWQQAQEGGNAAAQNIFLVKGSYRIGR